MVKSISLFALVMGLAVGVGSTASASDFVKRGASGHAYYWESGC